MPPTMQHVANRATGQRPPVLKRGFGAGANANTNITITGIKPGDVIVSVYELQPPTGSSGGAIANDRTATTSITAANTVQCTASTASNQVDVLYWSL